MGFIESQLGPSSLNNCSLLNPIYILSSMKMVHQSLQINVAHELLSTFEDIEQGTVDWNWRGNMFISGICWRWEGSVERKLHFWAQKELGQTKMPSNGLESRRIIFSRKAYFCMRHKLWKWYGCTLFVLQGPLIILRGTPDALIIPTEYLNQYRKSSDWGIVNISLQEYVCTFLGLRSGCEQNDLFADYVNELWISKTEPGRSCVFCSWPELFSWNRGFKTHVVLESSKALHGIFWWFVLIIKWKLM